MNGKKPLVPRYRPYEDSDSHFFFQSAGAASTKLVTHADPHHRLSREFDLTVSC